MLRSVREKERPNGLYLGSIENWHRLDIGLTVMLGIRMLGIRVRIAAIPCIVMPGMMYAAASILPEHNPFMDEHLIGVAIMVGLILTATGSPIGLGKIWVRTRLVERYPILR